MDKKVNADEIDEAQIVAYVRNPSKKQSTPIESSTSEEQFLQNVLYEQTKQTESPKSNSDLLQPLPSKSRQRKLALDEFRKQFMQAPKIDARKPVFVNENTRDDLERIVRLFGYRKLSVSGLIENLARHFIETYKEEVEQWRKM
jgi:hypothetical protein